MSLVVSPEPSAPPAGLPKVAQELRAEHLVRYYGKWRVVNDVSME